MIESIYVLSGYALQQHGTHGKDMRKHLIVLSLLLIILLVWPHHIYAEFYKYVDKDGVLRFVDEPGKIPPEHRESIKSYQEKHDRLSEDEKSTLLEKERREEIRLQEEQLAEEEYLRLQEETENRRNTSQRKELEPKGIETPVVIQGNHVLVPVVLGYEENEVEALLLLDTGASIIAIHQEIVAPLHITESKTARAQIASGKIVRFKLVNLSYIQIGPYRMENVAAGIIKHQGPNVQHNGLLGMNILRNLRYSVDYKKQVIRWNP